MHGSPMNLTIVHDFDAGVHKKQFDNNREPKKEVGIISKILMNN